MKTKAVYAGSFDPITKGHIDIVWKALQTFDELHIAIGTNPKKTRLFPVDQSLDLIRASMEEGLPFIPISEPNCHNLRQRQGNWTVGEFTGRSLVSYAREIGATHIVRGLRQVQDFNDEFVFTGANEQLDSGIIVTHFICKAEFLHVSSSTAREVASLKENVRWLVTTSVEKALKEKFA